ncbi:hypothetical protein [Archangium violaceum]|uniref:hypothetical protein n=1 Tax=Archangium violaceum TaxID=83451 RepID=UPI0036DBC1AB
MDSSTYHEEPPPDFNPLTRVPSFESPQERTARRLPRALGLAPRLTVWRPAGSRG